MSDWKDIGSNIIKLEGYGVYITYLDKKLYVCDMVPHSGLPTLDPDKNIEWSDLKDPPNQRFLNIINARFGTSFSMNSFNKSMTVTDIKTHMQQQKAAKEEKPMTDQQAHWFIKNMRELDK